MPRAYRVHHEHLYPAAERVGGLRRPAAKVPGLALRHRRLGLQHRRGHGPSGDRPGRVRAPAEVRRGDRPGAHPDSQGTERLHHQQPDRALVHGRDGPAGTRRERLREHRSNLDDHPAERHGPLRHDGSHGPRCRVSRREADRRNHPKHPGSRYARYIDEHFIQKGRLGVATGQGFYSYPNPAFAEPGFV